MGEGLYASGSLAVILAAAHDKYLLQQAPLEA